MQSFFSIAKRVLSGRAPGQLVIQITDRCNAICPQCGMRAIERFARATLPEDKIKKLIDDAVVRGVSIVSFTGGEPLLNLPLLVRLITYAHNAGIRYIRTGSNGFFCARPDDNDFDKRVNTVVEALAKTRIRNFWISIDSCDTAVHDRMRGFTDMIKGIERALPVFHSAGLYPAANMGINRNMAGENSLEWGCSLEKLKDQTIVAAKKFFAFVTNMGFTTVNMCYPMSNEETFLSDSGVIVPNAAQAIYAATSQNRVVHFTKQEKAVLLSGLSNAIQMHRSRIRIFTPLSSLYALGRLCYGNGYRAYPCRGGSDFYFASVNGNIYPCGYSGTEPCGEMWGKRKTGKQETACYKCEWECFRDPSELYGPISDLFCSPLNLVQRFKNDSAFMKLWITDIRYFMACRFFDGRIPPDYTKLARF